MNVVDMKPPTREPNPVAVSEVYALSGEKWLTPVFRFAAASRAYRCKSFSPFNFLNGERLVAY
jgi:hypothetical protein